MIPVRPLLLTVGILAAACSTAQTTPLYDYGPADHPARQKLSALNRGEPTTFRILQIGDSHTAGAFFSDELRQRLQKRWGNGGIGWVFPNRVAGQRTTLVRYQGTWPTLSSRKDRADFPFGGVLARSQQGSLTVQAAVSSSEPQQITLTVRPLNNPHNTLTVRGGDGSSTPVFALHGNEWQHFSLSAPLPLQLQTAPQQQWELGPVNIENGRPGIILSAFGINGAQLSHWSQWRQNWQEDLAQTRADLVILAYGTNEAFNANLNVAATEQNWQDTVGRIRSTLPEAAILIVGAPESLTGKQGACGSRPPRLDGVQSMQERVARQNNTLYWSWQEAMGGKCSMKSWGKQQLATADGVHFSAAGYRRAAGHLADALLQWAENPAAAPADASAPTYLDAPEPLDLNGF